MVYIGEYRSKIESQGRVIIPSKLRHIIKEEGNNMVYITKGIEKCIFVFPENVFDEQIEKINELSFTKGNPRIFTRLFYSGSFKEKIDKQGRIKLPPQLIEYAELKEIIVIIGAGKRIEIWDELKWNEFYKQYFSSYGEISEKIWE
ncbi:MAG: division/cell wall cluster transcriptional repressor MraZ [bacterium]|nr:division/cell wall cluster transcriptional repressor MraZ [bacterium]MCX7917898.1 division/cell wall cluster transcriptional repressor MraZ [bacterium]MDW8163918.1 division/cell wall cluster transcriptional repressor MraZ [Candidatus Omnitrophota bacterium]